jgi:Bifunctional DNA primase/polymerase, N-terminal/Primase C terminal 1 (PriCT-1)
MGASMGVASAAPIITAAVEYAARGWRVLPLNDKVPLAGSNGCLGATANPAAVALWPSGVNVGIATGRGLVVLDIDYRHDGGDSLSELERRHGQLPRTASVETGGGGDHLYFTTSALVRNSAGKLGPGLDVRGEGGYVVAPPSVHPDTGLPYSWDNHPDDVDPAPVPGWLEQLLSAKQRGRARRPVGEWRKLAAYGVEAGERNNATAQLAGHLLARGVDPYVALELVRTWNACRNRPPLSEGEVIRTVESIAARELKKWQTKR